LTEEFVEISRIQIWESSHFRSIGQHQGVFPYYLVEGFHAIFIISLIGESFQEEGTSILGDLQLEGLDLLKPSKGSLLCSYTFRSTGLQLTCAAWGSYLFICGVGGVYSSGGAHCP
jgi:hypothetical protein